MNCHLPKSAQPAKVTENISTTSSVNTTPAKLAGVTARYLIPSENHWAADIEADNLLETATTIWCITLENVVNGAKESFTTAKLFSTWLAAHPSAIFVGHNFIAYDAVMLNRFWGAGIPISRIVDTYVLSQLYNPSFPGGHSLEVWGDRLKFPKGEFSDFSHYSPEMLRYCQQDTALTARLFNKLSARMRQVGFSEEGCEIEHLAWNIIQNKQRRNGFPFNQKKAHELYVSLRAREEELKEEVYKLWPPELRCVAEYKQSRKKDGSYTRHFETHRSQFPKLEERPDGTYRAFDYVAFNLGSPKQRIEKLLELGWVPTQFTKRTPKGGGGNPKVDEDSLLEFAEASGKKELIALSKWIVVNSRANMLYNVNAKGEEKGWLSAYDDNTGCIHGKLFLASTLRYRHDSPNTANIPAVRLKKRLDEFGEEVKDENGVTIEDILFGEDGSWSYECRDLWTCGDPAEWSLVGIDGTGIQNRVLIHYLIKTVGEAAVADFKALALSNDVHKHNIKVLGLANKAAAKKAYYTLMMGGGGARIAADQAQFGTKLSAKEGELLRKKMIDNIPGFFNLIDKLHKDLEKTSRIKLCDGTPILVPSPHMVIPYLLQGDESRLMKKTMIYIDEEIRRRKLSANILKVADIHDEHQWRVKNEVVEEFIDFALPCFRKAGEHFEYLIPIDGDAKVGKTWSQTH